MKLQPAGSWQVENLRTSLYSVAPIDVASAKWWRPITGEPSESTVLKEREGLMQEQGPWRGARLVVATRVNRVDWVACGPRPDEERTAPSLPGIGSFGDMLSPFSKLVKTWLSMPGCPEPRRLAFGAVLLLPVESNEEGLRQLQPYLPKVEIDAEGSEDFIFQVNRPRVLQMADETLRINRIGKWSVVGLRVVGFSVEGSELFSMGDDRRQYALRLEIDINTSGDRTEPLLGDLGGLYERLIETGVELIKQGDVVD